MKKFFFYACSLSCLLNTTEASLLNKTDESFLNATPTKETPIVKDTFTCNQLQSNKYSMEFRASFYGFSSHSLREVFGQGAADYNLTAAIPINWDVYAWLGVDYLHKTGHVSGKKSTIQIVPATLGIKYMRPVCHFVPFIGAGLKWFWVDVHNHSSEVTQHISKNAPGGVVETGLQYLPGQHFLIDIYFNYSFGWVNKPHSHKPNVHSTDLNVSGWNLGGGIGYRF